MRTDTLLKSYLSLWNLQFLLSSSIRFLKSSFLWTVSSSQFETESDVLKMLFEKEMLSHVTIDELLILTFRTVTNNVAS